jgi:hypothetical protein
MVGSVMTIQAVLREITEWFHRVSTATLQLPSGWFGRPFDNQHSLTWATTRGDRLLIELDNQLLLIITRPSKVKVTEYELSIGDFSQLVFDWQEYGSLESHAETFHDGSLRFITAGGDL